MTTYTATLVAPNGDRYIGPGGDAHSYTSPNIDHAIGYAAMPIPRNGWYGERWTIEVKVTKA